MTESNERAFGEDQSLAHLLEFLSRLQEKPDVRKKVIEEIKRKVKDYITKSVDEFATEGGSSGYLFETIKKSTELRKKIVKTEQKYKHYTSPFQDGNPDQCVKHLINNVFPLFGCLYYMYYECCRDCTHIDGGGEWHDERCDGSGSDQYLNQWLRDETPSTETSEGGTKRMIQRGFEQGDLNDKEGDKLFPKSESEAAPLLDYLQGAQLQNALYYMLFLPKKWNRGQSGHGLLFLQALCKMVSENKFNGQYTATDDGQGFKSACQSVTRKISEVTKLNIIVPVAWTPEVQYKNLLEARHFWNYIEWLRKNLEQLIKSLTEMANDASNWDYTELISSETYGPYPWGFTFKDPNWDQKKGQLQQQLQQQVSQLTEALQTFKDALNSISMATSRSQSAAEQPSSSSASINSAEKPSPATEESSASTASTTSNHSTDSNDSTNSTASTIGGVAGGLGAAAATGAAAYAGSGFLGSAAEAVGKFFKGLIL